MIDALRAGQLFFKWRSYTPIPLLLAALLLARPTWWSMAMGYCLLAGGELLRISAVGFASGSTRTLEAGVGALITGGPYSYTRNPLYLGNFLISLGLCLAAWSWMPWMLFLFVAAFSLQYGFIVHLEETTLAEKLGDQYREYLKQVPRWAFRFTPYHPRYPERGDFMRGLKSERRTLQSIAIVTALLILRGFIFSTWLR
jgi:protein-S-isoprenylcysteine O-methyltransferase Ste14